MARTKVGNTLDDARVIQLGLNSRLRGTVSRNDPTDFYRFTLSRASQFSMVMRGLDNDAELSLLDDRGRVILQSDFDGESSEVIVTPVLTTQTGGTASLPDVLSPYFEQTNPRTDETLTGRLPLRAGTYFIRVLRLGAGTSYRITANAFTDRRFPPPRQPNQLIDPDRLATATRVTFNPLVSTTPGFGDQRTFRGSINGSNTEDFYRFVVTIPTRVSALLRGFDNDLNIELINQSGLPIRRSARGGDQPEVIVAPNTTGALNAGIYYVRVYRGSGSDSYRLTLTAQAIGFDTTAPGGGSSNSVFDLNSGIADANPDNFTVFGDALYFTAETTTTGVELWQTDGTTRPADPVRDINPSTASSNPSNLFVYNDFLYFSASDGVNGRELWRTDGDTTEQVRNINPGSASSDPSDFAIFNGVLYFTADDGVNGREIWTTDGTQGGTRRVSDINPGALSALINDETDDNELVALSTAFYFAANNGINGTELFSSNGTNARLVQNINPGAASSNPSDLVNFNNVLYFAADDGVNGRELWRSDGTNGGTELVINLQPGTNGSQPTDLTVVGNRLFFAATDAQRGTELFRSDGTEAGTVLVSDLISGSGSSSPADLVNINGVLYFTAETTDSGRQIFRSNGTQDGTVQVTDEPDSFNPSNLTLFNGAIYFTARSTASGVEVFRLAITPETP